MESFFKKVREDLHKIPEVGLKEFKTANYIRKFLENEGINYLAIETSTIVYFEGEIDNWVVFRADIDGLPISEENTCEYKSIHEGYMHACGHDGHTTILLHFAKTINKIKNSGEKLKKSIMLIFQAGEESIGFAEVLSKHEIYISKKIEGIFALHLDPELEEGKIGTVIGAMSYQSVYIEIELIGKGCHGAQVFKGIDSILIGAKLIEAYQSIVSRNIQAEDSVIISIGSFKAGTRGNIIPEKVNMLGTIRVVKKELIPFIKERIENINDGFEKAFGVKINLIFEPGYPAIFNSEKLFFTLKKAVKNLNIEIVEGIKLMGSEDFSFYLNNHVEGLFFMLGTRNENKNFVHPLHSDKFDFDPKVLKIGSQVFMKILETTNAIENKFF